MLVFFFILFTGFTIGISGAMIPGPLTLFTISGALKTNKYAGLKIISGHIIVEFILLLLLFFGFKGFLINKTFIIAISLVGGTALIGMGLILFLNSSKMSLTRLKADTNLHKGLVLGGAVFSLVSPGFFIWWVTIGFSTFVKASVLLGATGMVILALGHWLADAIWYGFLGYMVDKGKNYMNDRIYQNIMRFFSFILIVLGISFIINYK